jgi:hypothetical protein
MHRGVDAEGGGVADLQTDVMRFMAILALCLVVIFALVQSIPLRPSQPVPELVVEPVVEPVPGPVPEPVPVPAPAPVSAPEPVVIEQPAPEPVPVPPAPAPSEQEGFTLRFETDRALTRLVARGVVGLYAIGDPQTLRLNVTEGRMSFWEASTPNQFHEMDRGTVPADVVRALLRTAEIDVTTVKWGVTLPADMQRDLNGYLESSTGGALVIGANGTLRLEQ